MKPQATEQGTTAVSLTCATIDDMYADVDAEPYIKLSNVTVKTSDGKRTKKYPDGCFIYYDNPMSHHYCAISEMDGQDSYVSRDKQGRPLRFDFRQLADDT